jgi:glycosyltransferase involved in cell wall biosynthesis
MRKLSTLKLCFLAGTLGQGGAERQLFYLLQALCQAGATPRLLSFTQGEFWEKKIKSLGVSVTCAGNTASRWQRLLRIIKELRNDRPDILQSQHFFTNAYVSVAARWLQLSGIGAMRNDGTSEVNGCGTIGGWLNLRLPATLAANSQLAIQYAVANGVKPAQLYFLPNVVDTEWFKPSTSSRNSETPLTLLAVGRLVKQKRMDRFISILGRLRNDFNLNVRGLIVGSGRENEDLRPQLENQASRFGLLPDNLQFRGGVPDMRSVYHEAAICVLSSDFEGTPNVLLEAMASGLPVVATNVGGVPGIVQHGQTGFLHEPDDLDGLVADSFELVMNSKLRTEMGQRARAFVEERHGLQQLPAYLGGLYQQALPAKHHATARVVTRVST